MKSEMKTCFRLLVCFQHINLTLMLFQVCSQLKLNKEKKVEKIHQKSDKKCWCDVLVYVFIKKMVLTVIRHLSVDHEGGGDFQDFVFHIYTS